VQTLILRYVAFAVLASIANLAAQRVVLAFGDSAVHFAMAVATGTGTGLVLKYLLDKRWIFDDRSTGVKSNGRKFTLYTVMGVLTTVIFWWIETAFWLIWKTDVMRELGGVLGLGVGYVVKYNLDRRYVFTEAQIGLRGAR
jgi:putative flippase GtrA